jgi:hypothetical protein
VLKSTRPPAAIDPGWRPGTDRALTRCVRRSYRLALMVPGHPCLLWVSGRTAPGVHALGELTGRPDGDDDDPVVPVQWRRLADPVPRAELLADPRMRDAEVLRMPAGSNPSWLSRHQFEAVLDRVDETALGRWAP